MSYIVGEPAESPAAAARPVTPEEWSQLFEWSRCEHAPEIERALPDTFERQACRRPEHIAVVHDGRSVTYRKLQTLAWAAEARLGDCGIGPGDFVGVFCGHSPELIAIILGIWRRGAVYVPLDPCYPSDRLANIVRDAAPRLIIHDRALPDSLRSDQFAMLHTAAIRAADSPLSESVGPRGTAPIDLAARAVVLYTSGSTGTPKGVVLTHRNLANHNAWVIRAFELGPLDRRTALSSINFDASLEELFCTLNAGATLVLREADTLDSFARFVEFIERHRLTAFFLTTSLWRELTNYLEEAGRKLPASVRLLAVGGERATRYVYEKFLRVGGDRIRWINVYGPTETAIYATSYEHRSGGDLEITHAPPIGRPIDNTLVFVLDAEGGPVPPGEIGELYIGGAGVGEGYLHREGLNRERFVERPSADLPPGRYYRTGDQVRFCDNGQLEYVGRIDDQIKLRGFRIEPGEIDAVLLQHPDVRDAVTVPLTSQSGTQYLAAYIVLQTGAICDEQSVREFAERRLPSYMVPQAFYRRDTLPLSPNGKIDRRTLQSSVPSPDGAASEGAESTRVPTAFEQHILDIWGGSLQLEQLRLDDDFFAVGGDSLKAMAIVAKLEQKLQRPILITTLLTSRTVERLARQLAEIPKTEPRKPLVPLRDGDLSRPLFLIHALAGDVWIYAELAAALKTPSAIYGLQLKGLDEDLPTHATVELCAAEYIEQIQSVQPAGPYRLAGYSSGGWIAYEITKQLAELGERVEFLGMLDSGLPLALEQRYAPSLPRRLLRLACDVPEYLRELRALPRSERLRRVKRFGRQLMQRLVANYSPRKSDVRQASGPRNHEIFRWFDGDVSFFSEQRLQLIKKHYQALSRYEPQAVDGKMHQFRVRRQPPDAVNTPALGWERLLHGVIEVHHVGGTHGTLMKAPHVASLAEAVDTVLERLHLEQENHSVVAGSV